MGDPAVGEVAEWLAGLRLSEYAEAMSAGGVMTLADIRAATDESLRAMGVDKLGHRKRLLKMAAELGDSGDVAGAGAGADAVEPAAEPPGLPAVEEGRAEEPVYQNLPRKPQVFKAAPADRPRLPSAEPPPRPKPRNSGGDASEGAPPRSPVPMPRKASIRPTPKPRTSSSAPPTPSTEEPALGSPQTDAVEVPAEAEVAPAPASPVASGPVAPPRRRTKTSGVRSPHTAPSGESATPAAAAPSSPLAPRSATAPASPADAGKTPTHRRQDSSVSHGEQSEDEEGEYVSVASLLSAQDGASAEEMMATSRAFTQLNAGNETSMDAARQLMSRAAEGAAKGPRRVKMTALPIAERTKSGWLDKKSTGMMAKTHPWDKRYCVWENNQFSLYVRQGDTKPQSIIPLRDMRKVLPVRVKPESKHQFRFELQTVEKSYTLCADNRQEMTEWMMLLGAMITLWEPTPEDQLIGGAMSMPDKQGWIKKQGTNFREGWNKRYMAIKEGILCYYASYEDFKQEKPINTINTLLVTVKVGRGGKREKTHQFQLVTRQRNYEFQADSKQEMMSWVDGIQQSILWSLNQMQSSTSESRKVSDVIPPEQALEAIRQNPGNKACADCGTPKPDWASINIGTVFCIECAGIHRSLGVHISKVRSATLDEWTPSLLGITREIGALKANKLWDPNYTANRPRQDADKETREAYIRAKYERKEFIAYTIPEDVPLAAQLLQAVATPDLLLTVEILTKGGADIARDLRDEAGRSLMLVASEAGQPLQVELLTQNGFKAAEGEKIEKAAPSATDVAPAPAAGDAPAGAGTAAGTDGADPSGPPPAFHHGYLYKRGVHNTDWQKRWVVYEKGVLSYFKTDVEKEPAGQIALENIHTVCESPEQGPKYRFCFDVDTYAGRRYHFCAPLGPERSEWLRVLQSNLDALPPSTRFEFGTCDKQGWLQKRGEVNHAYKRRWFALKGKMLYYFKGKDDTSEQGHINLRKVTAAAPGVASVSKKGAVSELSGEPGEFSLVSDGRVYVLKAETEDECEEWLAAMRSTQVFGVAIDRNVTLVPIVVEKCCSFVENHGMFTEGIFRVPGNQHKIREIKKRFDMDDQAVSLTEAEYSAHDVGGALKLYFRELPQPLLTSELYDKFIAAAALPDHNAALYATQDLLNSLPYSNYETLKRMIVFLATIAEAEETNKMSIRNLALVFGPTLMTVDKRSEEQPVSFSNMGGEYGTISKLITYHEWLFNIDAKSEKEINLQQGLKKLEAAKQAQGSASSDVSTPFIHEILYESTSTAHTVPITGAMTGADVARAVVAKGNYAASADWSIFEAVQDGALERPIGDRESVLQATMAWTGRGVLRLRSFAAKELLGKALEAPTKGWLQLRMNGNAVALSNKPCRSVVKDRKWKRFWCTCDLNVSGGDPPALFYFKDEYQSGEVGHIMLRSLAVYTVTAAAGSAFPSTLGVRVSGVSGVPGDDQWFYLAVENEAELELWRACITAAGSCA